jgi:UDP-glucuronate 4-epimerase
MTLRDQPILVTGAAGCIGSHLVDRLLGEGHRVVGVDNFSDYYDPAIKHVNIAGARQSDNFTLIEADICDEPAVRQAMAERQPHIVVHLAAMAGVRPSIERPHYYTAVNVDGTVNVLDAAAASGAAKFIFASSSSVYGNSETVPFVETDPVDHPISPYAATKKAGELLCHSWWHVRHIPVTCLRFFTVFGPRQRPDLAIHKFMRCLRDNQPIPMFGDGSTSRDYTFVEDIVDGIRRAMDRCDGYRIYNLGGDHPVSLKELIAAIEKVTGKTAKIEQLPMQPGDVNRTWADLTRSKAELGYAPHTSLEEGLARQWAWLKAR